MEIFPIHTKVAQFSVINDLPNQWAVYSIGDAFAHKKQCQYFALAWIISFQSDLVSAVGAYDTPNNEIMSFCAAAGDAQGSRSRLTKKWVLSSCYHYFIPYFFNVWISNIESFIKETRHTLMTTSAEIEVSTGVRSPWRQNLCKILSVEMFQSGSHTANVNFTGDSVTRTFIIFSKLLEHFHKRLNWDHEKLKTHYYLKVFMRTAALSIFQQ